MTRKLNATITETDEHFILETRVRNATDVRAIPKDDKLGANLIAAIQAVFEANKPPPRPEITPPVLSVETAAPKSEPASP